MQVRIHDSAAEFRALAEPLYRRYPIGHTVELTGLTANELPADAVLVTVTDGGVLVGAAVQTPPYPLVCGGLPRAAVEPAVTALAGVVPDLRSVRGPREVAAAFAAEWERRTGAAVGTVTEERLHVLGDLAAPAAVAGSARAHADSDTDLLGDWSGRFFVETFGVTPQPIAHRAFVTNYLRSGARFVVWCRDDATPVSMAMVRRPVSGVARIGPVYTPDAERGHGYGSAVTAAAAATALEFGAADVVLFTDLANPVSNKIYRAIGFRPVSDWLVADFAPRVGSTDR
ncbi:GNAT family N-acetyltransferase [Mycolicibacterium sediminis]|uniref:N-acetyltransferase n=1 Tax=Mycolicibacterium sediminis TaxID=1286180 RepID=A0A7I7QVQ1_9MYCO|nr:GNAT family N-acetyltransferase [Mycolicibacterium sediminis]BBY30077.1 N-acetyltransferase [Mycolicibacterium sediminis]